ncbi:ankyrin repeat domain-containing protein 34A-like [Lingula anatina]|uniref:Ankyrin repeat domain-containing protein 34A-like n=1 Tax=Lingula anatina TaxID=7574 RepID=A0A1S3JUL1_LINAN|nr:ankyrin repeat domain-containing protein 34A-like [Lingula anatina]|eukprot:XP_013413779.1 ankyrin repeat domain-containing protein 34A-like [Lingula anatina]
MLLNPEKMLNGDISLASSNAGCIALLKAVSMGKFRMTRLLIEGGADVNVQNEEGQTALILVCMAKLDVKQTVRLLRYLLQHKADPNIKDKRGRTALMFACMNHLDYIVIKVLLQEGSNPVLRDNDGKTAIMYAAESNYTSVLNLLVMASKKKGQDVVIVAAPKSPMSELLTANRFMASESMKSLSLSEKSSQTPGQKLESEFSQQNGKGAVGGSTKRPKPLLKRISMPNLWVRAGSDKKPSVTRPTPETASNFEEINEESTDLMDEDLETLEELNSPVTPEISIEGETCCNQKVLRETLKSTTCRRGSVPTGLPSSTMRNRQRTSRSPLSEPLEEDVLDEEVLDLGKYIPNERRRGSLPSTLPSERKSPTQSTRNRSPAPGERPLSLSPINRRKLVIGPGGRVLERRGSGAQLLDSLAYTRPGTLPPLNINPNPPIPDIRKNACK